MTYRSAIKEGFRLINSNWQLVVVKFVAMIINVLLLFVLFLLPVIISVAVIGIDTEPFQDMRSIPENLSTIVSNYLVLFIIAAFFLLVYLLVASVISIYVYGASAGIIADSIRSASEKFSMRRFFRSGKELFMPVFGFLAVVLLLVIVVMLIVLLITIALAAFVDYLGQFESGMSTFISMFLILLSIALMLFLITFSLAVIFYGSAVLVLDRKGAFESTREAVSYLYRRPAAYWLYCILLGCIILTSVVLTLIGFAFSEIPVVGAIMYIPFQFFTSVAQSYIGLIVLAAVFIYYRSERLSADLSSGSMNTSSPEVLGQDRPHSQ
ncbi:MAG: hypothetical protein JSV21_10490 [Nitrospirota bacterium]|nr:MAG: hypothetical protein JSV21_10490 [Nitrospirota bacterium]